MSSLKAARADNFYHPPDWDPRRGSRAELAAARLGEPAWKAHPLRERAKKLGEGILVVRFEMPFDVRCSGCGNRIAKGVRFNAEKKCVGKYLSTKVWSFRMMCAAEDGTSRTDRTRNAHYIEVRTDPKAADYVVAEGAVRVGDLDKLPGAKVSRVDADSQTQSHLSLTLFVAAGAVGRGARRRGAGRPKGQGEEGGGPVLRAGARAGRPPLRRASARRAGLCPRGRARLGSGSLDADDRPRTAHSIRLPALVAFVHARRRNAAQEAAVPPSPSLPPAYPYSRLGSTITARRSCCAGSTARQGTRASRRRQRRLQRGSGTRSCPRRPKTPPPPPPSASARPKRRSCHPVAFSEPARNLLLIGASKRRRSDAVCGERRVRLLHGSIFDAQPGGGAAQEKEEALRALQLRRARGMEISTRPAERHAPTRPATAIAAAIPAARPAAPTVAVPLALPAPTALVTYSDSDEEEG